MNIGSVTKYFRSEPQETSTPKTPVPATPQEREALLFQKYGQKEVLLEWDSAGKLQVNKFNPKFVRQGAIIFLVIAFLLALMQDFVVILMIGSLVFFYYALTKNYSGENIHCQLTNYGLLYGTRMYYWDMIRHFFFSRRIDEELLMIDLREDVPPRLLITFPADKKAEIEKIFRDNVLFLEVEPKGSFDKSLDKILSRFNLEGEHFEDNKQL